MAVIYDYILLVSCASLIYFICYLIFRNRNYWKNKNVPHLKSLPILGNYKDFILLKKHLNLVVQEMCQKFPNEPYFGAFYGTDPVLIVQDPNLLRLILTKDYYYFNGRETSGYSHKEIITKQMFTTSGDEWKVLRTNMSPLFSSAKMKKMFYLIKNCSDSLEDLVNHEMKINSNIDVKKLLTRYTVDCITTCTFGFNFNTMKQDVQKPYSTLADSLLRRNNFGSCKKNIRSIWPGLFYAFGFRLLHGDTLDFFSNIVLRELKKREGAESLRNDFLDLMLAWKTQKYLTGDSLNPAGESAKSKINFEVNDEFLIGQTLFLFMAGFETTATTLTFLLYEIAKNESIQEKVIEEVDAYFAKYESIEYDCIHLMPYTESCIEETMRLYPALGVLFREVMDDYTLESLPKRLHLKKGDRIHIPVYHIQRNPEYFPDPEEYRPERFFGEEKKNIKPYTQLPFGGGPRLCLGMRFSKMPIYAALLKILKYYKVELAEGTPYKLTFTVHARSCQSIDNILLKFIPRNV